MRFCFLLQNLYRLNFQGLSVSYYACFQRNVLNFKFDVKAESHQILMYKNVEGVPVYYNSKLGFSAEELSDQNKNKFKLNDIDTGVVITSVKDDSSAQKAGLSPGMVIIRVGQIEVNSMDVIDNAIKNAVKQKRKALLLLVKVKSGTRFVALELK